MKKIISFKEAVLLSKKIKLNKKTIILAGGCFDILHIGHILFLKKAKTKADYLFVLIEGDKKIKELKGENRPIHNQKDRAEIISALEFVDYVIPMPYLTKDIEYDKLVEKLNPSIIAATFGDENAKHKKRQAKKIGAKLIFVTKNISKASTSKVAEIIAKEI